MNVELALLRVYRLRVIFPPEETFGQVNALSPIPPDRPMIDNAHKLDSPMKTSRLVHAGASVLRVFWIQGPSGSPAGLASARECHPSTLASTGEREREALISRSCLVSYRSFALHS